MINDNAYGDGIINLQGVIYDCFLFASAPSYLTFDLNSQYRNFSACTGINSYGGCGQKGRWGASQWRVLGDGVVLRDYEHAMDIMICLTRIFWHTRA